MKVSFIIPSYNSYLTIAKTIESIASQSKKQLIQEIVVVDSSDDAKTKDLLNQMQVEHLTLAFQPQKTSPANGRNIGAKMATGDLLCFIDSDVYLDPDWLQGIIESYKNGCLAGGGAIALPPFQKGNKLATAQLYLQFNEYLDTVQFHERLFVPSCNLFCERRLFEKIGGFPDLRASEDTMFCLALNKLTKIWFVPQAKCFHIFREDGKAFARNQELLGKYVIVYRRQYYKKWFYRGIFAVVLFPVFLTIKMTWIIQRINKAGKDHRNAFIQSLPVFLKGMMYWSIGFIKGCFDNNETAKR